MNEHCFRGAVCTLPRWIDSIRLDPSGSIRERRILTLAWILASALLLATTPASYASDRDVPPASTLPSRNASLSTQVGGGGRHTETNGVTRNSFQPSQALSPGTDVDVSNLTGNEAEVSIDINPNNPKNMVICGHAPGFATMNTFYTTNRGQSWTRVALGNAQDGITSTFRFDPTVAFDADGNVYVAYGVQDADGAGNPRVTVVVARSADGGQSYTRFARLNTNNSFPLGGGQFLPGNDKWGIATGRDPNNASQQDVYVAWTQNVAESGTVDQRIVVSHSTDGGQTFTAPLIIADDAINGIDRSLFADPAVGPNGEVWVAWHDFGDNRILIDESTDGGTTWGTDRLVTGLTLSGLSTTIPAQPDRGIPAGPVLDVDKSGGANNGRLYIAYCDAGSGGFPNSDIFVRRSTNGGSSWSAPVTVNDDGGTKSQFLPWLDVDQTSGFVNAIWYDARNDANNKKVEVFHAVSKDGGASFGANTKVSDGQSDQSTSNASRWGNNFLEYIGVTSLKCSAYAVWSDNSANAGDLDYYFDSVSLDPTPPALACPADLTIECDSHCDPTLGGVPASDAAVQAFLNGATASDNCDPSPTVGPISPPTCFPLGLTPVTFRATDDAGNHIDCVAVVQVVDHTAPVIACPVDLQIECSSHCDPSQGGVLATDPAVQAFLAGASATDVCDPSPSVGPVSPPACFPLGVTPVTFRATDRSGNPSQCVANVRVVDTKPPTIAVTLNRTALWPPNHKLADIVATVTVTDVCDPNPICQLRSITSNEPDNGLGDGDTPNDIQMDDTTTCDLAYQLRSERSGLGNGRKYTITYSGTDHSGNQSLATAVVRVAHDQGAGAVAGDGWNQDGSDFLGGAQSFALVVRSLPRTVEVGGDPGDLVLGGTGGTTNPGGTDPLFSARAIDPAQAFIGNTAGALAPQRTALMDVDGDGLTDLVAWYDVNQARAILASSATDDGPLGLHFSTRSLDYLVPSIFALGAPVRLPTSGAAIAGGGTPSGSAAGSPQAGPGQSAGASAAAMRAPSVTELSGVYPNPVLGEGMVAFSLAHDEAVELAVFDVRGARVRTLESRTLAAGRYQVRWDGHDQAGRKLTGGIYFVRLSAGRYIKSSKTILMP